MHSIQSLSWIYMRWYIQALNSLQFCGWIEFSFLDHLLFLRILTFLLEFETFAEIDGILSKQNFNLLLLKWIRFVNFDEIFEVILKSWKIQFVFLFEIFSENLRDYRFLKSDRFPVFDNCILWIIFTTWCYPCRSLLFPGIWI